AGHVHATADAVRVHAWLKRSQAGHDLGVFVGRQNLRIPVGSPHHRLRLWLLPPEGHPAARTAHERGGFSAAPGGGSVLLAANRDSIIAGQSEGRVMANLFDELQMGTVSRRRLFQLLTGAGGSAALAAAQNKQAKSPQPAAGGAPKISPANIGGGG